LTATKPTIAIVSAGVLNNDYGHPTQECLERLPRYDAEVAQRYTEAKARGRVLRYVGRVTAKGEAAVGLVEFECVEAHAHRLRGSRVFALCVGDCVRRAERNDIRNIHL